MAYKYMYDEEERPYTPPKLKTNRSMWKLELFSILTLGIYSIFFFTPFSFDLDLIYPKRDGTKTMNYLTAFIVSLFTFRIAMFAWHYLTAQRIEEALAKRNIDYEFSTGTFWGWYFFGSFILIGPFIYLHKLCRAMNLLCEDFNKNPEVV